MTYSIDQLWLSETEPELGAGKILKIENKLIFIEFLSSGEVRTYRDINAPLKRFTLAKGDKAFTLEGVFTIEKFVDENGLLKYSGDGPDFLESKILSYESTQSKDLTSQLLSGQYQSNTAFQLRLQAIKYTSQLENSSLGGFLGPRIDLIPHQFFICKKATEDINLPRKLLSDEVGLGKTIEAGLIYHQLVASKRIDKTLIIVPPYLKHQWFIEFYRKFNQLFTIVEEEMIMESEEQGYWELENHSNIICDFKTLEETPGLVLHILEQNFDLLIMDEIHHFDTEDQNKFRLLQQLSSTIPGVLFLSATPITHNEKQHFKRLQLLNPEKYQDFKSWVSKFSHYKDISKVLKSFSENHEHDMAWDDLSTSLPKVAQEILQTFKESNYSPDDLLNFFASYFGVGDSQFRNSRKYIGGFPKRTLIAQPMEAEKESDFFTANAPKVQWLINLLKENPDTKYLCILTHKEDCFKLSATIQKSINIDIALFHEDLSIVNADRAAAWFAEEEGARLLISSEVGSEGRNFQFVQNIILYDLPLSPNKLEQRIGRLDRIGQQNEIFIHVPYYKNTAQEFSFLWHQEGLDSIEKPVLGAELLFFKYKDPIKEHLQSLDVAAFKGLLKTIQQDIQEYSREINDNRDFLLEWNSFHDGEANALLNRIDDFQDTFPVWDFMLAFLNHHQVGYEEGTVEESYVIQPDSSMLIEDFPGVGEEGQSFTSSRQAALARDDYQYLSWDHPTMLSCLDMVLSDQKNCVSCVKWGKAPSNTILFQFVFLWNFQDTNAAFIKEHIPFKTFNLLFDAKKMKLIAPKAIKDADFKDYGQSNFLNIKDELKPLLNKCLKSGTQLIEAEMKKIKTAILTKIKESIGIEKTKLSFYSKQSNSDDIEKRIQLLNQREKQLTEKIQNTAFRLDSIRCILS